MEVGCRCGDNRLRSSAGVPPPLLQGMVGCLLDMCATNARDAAIAAPLLEVGGSRKGGREGGREREGLLLSRRCWYLLPCTAAFSPLPCPPLSCLLAGVGPAGASSARCAAALCRGGPCAGLQGAAGWDDGEGGRFAPWGSTAGIPWRRVQRCGEQICHEASSVSHTHITPPCPSSTSSGQLAGVRYGGQADQERG